MKLVGPTLLILAATVAVAALASAQDASVTFVNHSSVNINHIYVSPQGVDAWGLDQLGHHVLRPGDSLQLSGIGCRLSDIKLVDEDQRPCTLRNVKLCDKDAAINLTDTALALCRRQR